MKKTIVNFAVVLIWLISLNIHLYYRHYQMTHLSIQGSLTERDEDNTFNLQITLIFSGDLGQTIINGELIDNEGNTHPVHRSSSFRFKQVGNSNYITNYSVAELANNTVDQSTLTTFLPSLSLFKGLSSILDIHLTSNHNYMIVSDKYPHLIC